MSAKSGAPERISWITGMKGLACYLVFLHHLVLNLDGNTYHGGPVGSISWLLSSTPLGIITNGNFYTFVFFLLSAWLIGNSFLSYDKPDLRSKIGTFCLKRYFRLMLPILAYAVLRHLFVLTWNGFGQNCPLPAYPDWRFVIKRSLYSVFAEPDTSLTGPLWMIHALFTGSYVALLLALPDRKNAKTGIALSYCVVLGFAFLQRNFYLAAAAAGVFLADLKPLCGTLAEVGKFRWMPKLLIPVGLFFGSVPSAVVPDPFFLYRFTPSHPEFWHCLGGFLLLLGIQWEHALSRHREKPALVLRFLQSPLLQLLGKLSFSMFLVHEALLILLFAPLQSLCQTRYRLPEPAAVLILVVVISAAAVLLSWLFYRVIEENTNRLCRHIRL